MVEEVIIKCCAPTLAGLKAGSIFCLNRHTSVGDMKYCLDILRGKGLKVRGVRGFRGQRLIYVYRPDALEAMLRDRCSSCILRQSGYGELTVEGAVNRLLKRIATMEDFPHEIGLFLGYPTEDVRGYIDNKGQNFILSGMWKVYCNEEQAKRCFASFKKCTSVYMSCYRQGRGLDRLTVRCG